MKLAVSSYSLSRWMRENDKTLYEAIDWIADHAEGVEFSGLSLAEGEDPMDKAARVRAHCEKKNLPIVGYSCGADLLVADDAEQRQRIDRVKAEVDIAAALGVRSMRHDVTRGFPEGWTGPRSFAAALERVVPAVREITEHGKAQGVRTTVENHGFFMQASWRVEELILAVDNANYGLTMDMGNFMCVNEDPVDAIGRLASYVVIAHVKDFYVRPKATAPLQPGSGFFQTPTGVALRGAIVGHGDLDIPGSLRALRDGGYDDWLSLEFEGIEDPPRAIELGLAYLRDQLG